MSQKIVPRYNLHIINSAIIDSVAISPSRMKVDPALRAFTPLPRASRSVFARIVYLFLAPSPGLPAQLLKLDL